MNGIRDYLLAVSAAALLLSLVLSVLPKGSVKKAANFTGSLLLLLVVITPLAKLEISDLARSIAQINMEVEQMQSGVQIQNREIMAQIIKTECETYILDKAAQMSIHVSAEVTVSEVGDYPYPVSVVLQGNVTQEDKTWMEHIIEQDLGIPAEKQEWQ